MTDEPRALASASETALERVLLAEYRSLREEIGRFQDHQKEIMNFAYVVVLALATAAAAVHDNPKLFRPILFFIPWAYFLLAAAYTDRTLKILLPADYIHNELRHKLRDALGIDGWGWENFKRRATVFDRQMVWTLDKSRWLVFVVPAAFGAAFFTYKSWPPTGPNGLWIAADLLALALGFYVMFIVDEAAGIYEACDSIFRPEPLSGVLRIVTIALPALLIAQFPAVAFLEKDPVLLGLSLGACAIGFAIAVAELLYYSNYKLQADSEFVYRISLFGHVQRWKKANVIIRFQRRNRWSLLNIIIKLVEGKKRSEVSFHVWGGFLEKFENGTWKRSDGAEAAVGAIQPRSKETEPALARDLLGLAAGQRGSQD